MLKTILSVSGKPGLYKMISQGKNMTIVESLIDGKRSPVYAKDKVISLRDTAIFTNEEDEPLYKVLSRIREKEAGNPASLSPSTAKPDELRAYLATVLPNFDRERVYPSDIKKLLNWYNLLVASGISDFSLAEKTAEDEKEAAAE